MNPTSHDIFSSRRQSFVLVFITLSLFTLIHVALFVNRYPGRNDTINTTIEGTRQSSQTCINKQQQPRKPKVIGINYAHNCCYNTQMLTCESAIKVAGFDECIAYNFTALDSIFVEENKEILDQKRGGGYWIWKPYIILKTLLSDDVQWNDVIVYADAARTFTHHAGSYVDVMTRNLDPELMNSSSVYREFAQLYDRQDIMPFHLGYTEYEWTKRDAFEIIVGMMPEDVKQHMLYKSSQISAAMLIVRKTFNSIRFVSEFLTYATDKRIVTDIDNTLNMPNFRGFQENRHDQTVLSLLVKKHKLKTMFLPAYQTPSPPYAHARFYKFYNPIKDRT